jgi:hypothetical protein
MAEDAAAPRAPVVGGVAQRRERAGPHAGPPHHGRLEFARPGPVYLRGGGFCPRRARRFWLDWAATTYHHRRRAFARITVEMRWARRLLAPGFVDELVRWEAQFTQWGQAHSQVSVCTYDTRTFPDDVLRRLSRVHSRLWVDGRATPNPFPVDLARLFT